MKFRTYFVGLAALFASLVFGANNTLTINGSPFKPNGGVFSVAATTPPVACDYYIGTGGSDSNPGTSGSPWAITAINTKQATYAAHVVCLQDGTYNIFSLYSAVGHDGYTPVLAIQGGSSGSPTIIRALNVHAAIIQANNGATYPPNNPAIGNNSSSNKQYVTIDGIVLTGHSSKGIDLGDYAAAFAGTRYAGWTVKNCEITGQNATSIASGNNLSSLELLGGTGTLIQNNYIHDNIGYSSQNPDHMSGTVQWLTVGATYEYNSVIQSGNIYGKEDGNSGTTIRYNYVDASGWSQLPLISDFVGVPTDSASGISNSIHHNVGVGGGGFSFNPTLGSGYFKDTAYIYNNTIVASSVSNSIGLLARVDNGLLNSYNNIVRTSTNSDYNIAIFNIGAPGLVDYNLYYSTVNDYTFGEFSSKNSNTRVGDTYSQYKTNLGGIEAHSLEGSLVDPLFVGTGGTSVQYKLQSGSPAKNAGKSDGTTGGSTVDIGAWGNNPPSRIGCNFSGC